MRHVLSRLLGVARKSGRSTTARRAPRGARPSLEVLEQRDLMATGWYDPTFGAYGRVTANFENVLGPNAKASAVAIQPDGKIVIAGTVNTASTTEYFGVIRLKTDGTLDQTFGIDGRSVSGFQDLPGWGPDDEASAVAIDSQGRIVVAGTAEYSNGSHYFGVVRLNPDGYYDTSFGIGGRSASGFQDLVGGTSDHASAVAIDAQGRIVVAGSALNGNYSYYGVVRLQDNGYYDQSFGIGGRSYFGFSDMLSGAKWDEASAVAIDAQGRIVVAGTAAHDAAHEGGTYYAVGRLNDSGWFDTSFGLGGRSLAGFQDLLGGIYDDANAVAIDPQGRIVVAGSASTSDNHVYFGVVRLQDNGYYDTSFGLGGRSYFGFQDVVGGTVDAANAVAIDYAGRIVVAGTLYGSSGAYFAVGRLNDSGWFDTSFGVGGRSYGALGDNLVGGENSAVAAMANDAWGNIVVVGSAYSSSGVWSFGAARIQGDYPDLGDWVPDLTGVSFNLTSLDNSTTHALVINAQADNGDGTATIWGTWDGKAMTGTIQTDAYGRVHIIFQWMGNHTFYGTITGGVLDPYAIDGMVSVLGGGGPGHCVGDQTM
jgi:uncharacterized delta-60 repeat protein